MLPRRSRLSTSVHAVLVALPLAGGSSCDRAPAGCADAAGPYPVDETLLFQLPAGSHNATSHKIALTAARFSDRDIEIALGVHPQHTVMERLAAPFGVSLPSLNGWRGMSLRGQAVPPPSGGKVVDLERRSLAQVVTFAVATLFVQLVLFASLGQFYRHEVSDTFPQVDAGCSPEDLTTWRAPLLTGAWWDRSICLWSFFFPCARWADNMSKVGVTSFWTALSFIALGILTTEMTDGLFWGLFVLFLVRMRQKMRYHFGMDAYTCAAYANDCLAVGCCFPCAVAQDAHQVEQALHFDRQARAA